MKGYKKNGKFHPIRNKRSPSKNRKKKFENAKIQSLIFNKKKFNITEAKEWADDHGFTAVKVEPMRNTLRIRQFSPNKIKRGTECKTIQFGGSGVQGVLCDTPEKFKRERYAKKTGGKLSTSLGAIISPKKKPPKTLLKQINSDLDFRDELIDKNKEIKAEIKADPESTFAQADVEEFKENSKEIRELSKDIKRAFKDIPKDEREGVDRTTINRLRVLR